MKRQQEQKITLTTTELNLIDTTKNQEVWKFELCNEASGEYELWATNTESYSKVDDTHLANVQTTEEAENEIKKFHINKLFQELEDLEHETIEKNIQTIREAATELYKLLKGDKKLWA